MWVKTTIVLLAGTLIAALRASSAEESLQIDRAGGKAILSRDGRKVLEYRFEGVPFKPYVKELCTPEGINVLLDSPSDHRHHHGLMWAVAVCGTDFWTEEPAGSVGTELSRSLEALAQNAGGAGLVEELAWTDPQGVVVLDEKRTVRSRCGPAEAASSFAPTLITWSTRLNVPAGRETALLSGAHYFGLGLRLAPTFNNAAAFIHPEGSESEVVRGDERVTPGRWCACTGAVDGHPVTVAMFDHPLNPRSPARWFTMATPFAYLSATLNLYKVTRSIGRGEPLDLCYGVAAWDGHRHASEIETAYQRWLALENPLADHVNVASPATGATASASSEYGPDYVAAKAIDGRYLVRETDKWNSKAHITPHYLRIDLGQPRPIDTIVVRHEGALPRLDAFLYNSEDFRVQHALGPWGPWLDLVAPVRGNTDNVTVHRFDRVTTRYIRILLETAEPNGGNAYGRIAEVEVYAPKPAAGGGAGD
ncbi:MAG: DUF6807 family protein [Planctomycetota bacterium]